MSDPLGTTTGWSWRDGVTYGLLGMPLAFAALPLYVVLPHHYASTLGLPLALVGGLLMLVRLLDAGVEPWLGRFSDHLFRRGVPTVLLVAAGSTLLLGGGLMALFFPQVRGTVALGAWMVGGMLLTCLAHSQLAIAHQAWGVRLGGDVTQRSRIVAWREGWGLLGVVSASALSVRWGAEVMLVAFALMLLLGAWAWWHAPRPVDAHVPERGGAEAWGPQESGRTAAGAPELLAPLRIVGFRRLLAVFLCNGIASAIPASLMLFYAQDRLQATSSQVAVCLVLYFVCAALSLPVWVRAVRRVGLARCWLAGMLMAVLCFAFAAGLASGQVQLFGVICALTGVALGADLAVPGAMLAVLIEREGEQGRSDGAFLGWWSLATKLNLALAAGVALPLLQWLGYTPGSQDPVALQRLAWTYALLPCVLKLGAAALLVRLWRRERGPWRTPPPTPLSSGVKP